MKRKLIVDCDPGIDDLFAITLAIDAHQRGELELLAITLVKGNTTVGHEAVNTARILDAMKCYNVRVFMFRR